MELNDFDAANLNALGDIRNQQTGFALGDSRFFGGQGPPGEQVLPQSPDRLSWMDDPNDIGNLNDFDDELDADHEIDDFYDPAPQQQPAQQGPPAAVPAPATIDAPAGDPAALPNEEDDASKQFKCENNACQCGKGFDRAAQLTRHVAFETFQFACDKCDLDGNNEQRRFGSRNDKQRHYREVHRIELNGQPATVFPCPDPTCDRHGRPFLRAKNQEEHINKRHPGFQDRPQTNPVPNQALPAPENRLRAAQQPLPQNGTNPAVPARGTKRSFENIEVVPPSQAGPSGTRREAQDPTGQHFTSELQRTREEREAVEREFKEFNNTAKQQIANLQQRREQFVHKFQELENEEKVLVQSLARWRDHKTREHDA